jgi:hypothetical protein
MVVGQKTGGQPIRRAGQTAERGGGDEGQMAMPASGGPFKGIAAIERVDRRGKAAALAGIQYA